MASQRAGLALLLPTTVTARCAHRWWHQRPRGARQVVVRIHDGNATWRTAGKGGACVPHAHCATHPPPTHPLTRTHTHTRTHVDTHTHTHTRTRTCMRTRTSTRTHTRTLAHTCTRARAHTRTHARTHARKQARAHASRHARTQAGTHARARTQAGPHARTHAVNSGSGERRGRKLTLNLEAGSGS